MQVLLTAEPRFVIPKQLDKIRSTIGYSLILYQRSTNRRIWETFGNSLASFQAITVHFINTKWKFRTFVLETDSFLDKHRAHNIAKSYDNAIENFTLT